MSEQTVTREEWEHSTSAKITIGASGMYLGAVGTLGRLMNLIDQSRPMGEKGLSIMPRTGVHGSARNERCPRCSRKRKVCQCKP